MTGHDLQADHGPQLSQLNCKPFFYSVTDEKAEHKYKKILGKKEAFIICHIYRLTYIQPNKIPLIPILPFPPFREKAAEVLFASVVSRIIEEPAF